MAGSQRSTWSIHGASCRRIVEEVKPGPFRQPCADLGVLAGGAIVENPAQVEVRRRLPWSARKLCSDHVPDAQTKDGLQGVRRRSEAPATDKLSLTDAETVKATCYE